MIKERIKFTVVQLINLMFFFLQRDLFNSRHDQVLVACCLNFKCRTLRWVVRQVGVGIDRKIDANFLRPLVSWTREESRINQSKHYWMDTNKKQIVAFSHVLQHLVQVTLRTAPWCGGVTEENKVWHDSSWIDGDHLTHPAEGRVLLFIIAYVAQRRAPKVRREKNESNAFNLVDILSVSFIFYSGTINHTVLLKLC